MKTKYADLIKQLERVTEVYDTALAAVRELDAVTDVQEDVFWVFGGVNFYGEKFEDKRSIHLRPTSFIHVAMDCGEVFEVSDQGDFTKVDCTVFGYRVFSLIKKGSTDEAQILKMAGVK